MLLIHFPNTIWSIPNVVIFQLKAACTATLSSNLISLIYRITSERIEVLNIVHAASSVGKIRANRNIRL